MEDATGSAVRQRKKPPVVVQSNAALTQSDHRKPPVASLNLSLDIGLSFFSFCVLFASHVLAAMYHPIQDCDEVYNYWEPTHYLSHGHGFQTWEYSPVYAIRSWAYSALHALVTLAGKPLTAAFGNKGAEFYLLRIFLGMVCALCESRLFTRIATVMNPRVAFTFLFIMATSPGMFHAGVAYLPSSFAMYTTMLGMAAFMDWRGGLRTAQGMFAIGTGAVLGWPFAAAMVIPFLLEEALLAIVGVQDSIIQLTRRVFYGTVRVLLILAGQIAVDAFFYKKLVIVPFNIVWYNVFSSKGGPDLYGTEPWHYYLRNLFLNFHIWLLLALLSLPLLLAQHIFRVKGATKSSYLRGIAFLSPFYLWLTIFTLQPHKEERFMYPAYPALALNAAVSTHIILANFGSTDPKDLVTRIPSRLRLFMIFVAALSILALSAFRTIGTITAYNAPLAIYKPLHDPSVADSKATVCLGKEWYRFPSHYLLPDGMKARFIKSEFSGLLPGQFHEGSSTSGLGLFPGTWLVPPGMNDENREDAGKYIDLKDCNFIVDSRFPSTQPTALEPDLLTDTENWERVRCLPFLDAGATGAIGRMGWVPDLPFLPEKYRRAWGEYCLLKRKSKRPAASDIVAPPRVEILG